jgi:hypothetical protein
MENKDTDFKIRNRNHMVRGLGCGEGREVDHKVMEELMIELKL